MQEGKGAGMHSISNLLFSYDNLILPLSLRKHQ